MRFYDLTHRLGRDTVLAPSPTAVLARATRLYSHAMHDCYAVEYDGILHHGTHMDAPAHVAANAPFLTAYEPWRFFGTGVAVAIPKGRWGVIMPEELEKASPGIQPGDIVMINTGSHRNFGDNDAYYAYSPGLHKESAEWFVDKQVKLVGVDTHGLDHPLATAMVGHGPGPTHPHLIEEYTLATGRGVTDDFPEALPVHKTMMRAGLPGIENIGGELDEITGKRCTFMAFPWRFPEGDGCPVRVVAIVDPEQEFRIPQGSPDDDSHRE